MIAEVYLRFSDQFAQNRELHQFRRVDSIEASSEEDLVAYSKEASGSEERLDDFLHFMMDGTYYSPCRIVLVPSLNGWNIYNRRQQKIAGPFSQFPSLK